jgi:hypothetical protein
LHKTAIYLQFRPLTKPNYGVVFPLAPQRRANYACVAMLKMPCIWAFQRPLQFMKF